jgi:hypothetical protein
MTDEKGKRKVKVFQEKSKKNPTREIQRNAEVGVGVRRWSKKGPFGSL